MVILGPSWVLFAMVGATEEMSAQQQPTSSAAVVAFCVVRLSHRVCTSFSFSLWSTLGTFLSLAPPPISYRLGWRRFGNDTVKHAAHYVSYCRQPGYRFCFSRSPTAGCRVRSFVRGKEPLLRTRELIVSRSVQGKAPKRQLRSTPIAVSGNAYTGN